MPQARNLMLGKGVRLLDFYAQFTPTPLSIQNFLEFGTKGDELTSFKFLRSELPVRLANIMKEIHLLPENLLKMPSVKSVNSWYIQSFNEITEFEKMKVTDSTLLEFCKTLVQIEQRHDNVVPTMAQGVLELKEAHSVDNQTDASIQYFLDRFFMSRIGIRMLIHQHNQLFSSKVTRTRKPGSRHIGCLHLDCNVKEVILDAYENAKFLCDQYYMASPELIIDEPSGESINIVYVPSHLYHMLFELFKNSMRAVLEAGSDSLPPLKLTIIKGKEDICIKLSDMGGGIPRSQMDLLFRYMYSTAPQPQMSGAPSAPLAGYGYGLPISRLYARYFHGDLRLLPCDGFGTDAIIYLKIVLTETKEVLPVFNKRSSRAYKATIGADDWSDSAAVGRFVPRKPSTLNQVPNNDSASEEEKTNKVD